MTHLIVDLDDTLFRTRNLMPYRQTGEGRRYLENMDNLRHLVNRSDMGIEPISQPLTEIVRRFAWNDDVTVVTNSPEDYAKNLLQIHDIVGGYVVGAAGKPQSGAYEWVIEDLGINPDDILVIGDSGSDILPAHSLGLASIAVPFGAQTAEQLRQAEPSAISRGDNLDLLIEEFEKGQLRHVPRSYPNKLNTLPRQQWQEPSNYHITACVGYNPARYGQMDNDSGRILDLKASRYLTAQEINEGKTLDYFAGGAVRTGRKAIDVIKWAVDVLSEVLSEELSKLKEPVTVIATPYSAPTFCYPTDVNQVIVNNIPTVNNNATALDDRLVQRKYLKEEAHTTSGRTPLEKQYQTLGILQTVVPRQLGHIIIFDDVTTTGQQLRSMAHVLDGMGIGQHYRGIAVGQTQRR